MSITAIMKRSFVVIVSIAFVLALAGCASSMSGTTPSSDTQATEMSATTNIDGTVEQEAGEQVVTRSLLDGWDSDSPRVELIQGDGFDQIVVRGGIHEDDVITTRLASPERLVIDIFNYDLESNEEFDVNTTALSRVRVGSHEDKSRVVLDLSDSETINHEVEVVDGELVVTLDQPWESNITETTAIETEGVADDSFASPTISDEGTLENNEATTEAQEIIETESTDVALIPTLEDLRLENIGPQQNRLIADMESAGYYTFERTAASEYVLRLEGAQLSPTTARTILAGQNQGAIRSVRSLSDGDDILLRIFTTPTASLTASPRGNSIIVSAKGIEEEISGQDVMAQMAPEEGDVAAVEGAEPLDSELAELLGETPRYTGRLISLDLQETDIDNALRIIAEVSNLNIIASDDVTGKVTLRLIDVPWDQALDVILKTNGLDKVQEGNVIRIAPVEKLRQEREALRQAREAEEDLEPLQVKYIRVSYAKAAELQPLVETVLSERGTVAYDERTNQLIVKDIIRGVRNTARLVAKLDLRTPQVLLETQIVEAQRSLTRNLGAELGFNLIQSPETGNATGYNFPNSISVGGSVDEGSNVASSFPAALEETAGSAISILLGSADGTKSLDARISSLEQEGRLRVVSRPSVVTTNNTPATIRSVEKIRIRTPDGGLSVATGQGASASGGSPVATETIEIGITLDVTPQASPDYFVLLDLEAKSSTFGANEVDGIPSEVERSANSTVLVSSGQTFTMGGIYKISDRDTVSGVPFFKDIPFLGHLFRSAGINNQDEELIFFITPRIVEGSFDDAAMKAAL